jgi:maleylpyruvate isomerase
LKQPEYLKLNPSAVVPTVIDGDAVLTQTMAIIEYLDETYPDPPLLPRDRIGRARVRAIAQVMVSDTHPLSTARVIDYLDGTLSREDLDSWLRHWNVRGFGAVETMLDCGGISGTYCHGDTPTVADIALVSQVFVAKKSGVDISSVPNVRRIYNTCMEHPAFSNTAPSKQPDAQFSK